MSGIVEFVTAGLDAMRGALIEYREHLVQAAFPCRTVRLLASSVGGGTKAAG